MMNMKDVLQNIWANELAIRENLVKSDEALPLLKMLVATLEEALQPNSLVSLRYRKFIAGRQLTHWWSTMDGYPTTSLWRDRFQPLLNFLEQHEAEKTLKARFKDANIFAEARYRDDDVHILIGERDGTAEKAHLVIDGESGEIRVELKDDKSDSLVQRIEAVLTLRNGQQVRSTREILQEID
jgi:hypothetical protein